MSRLYLIVVRYDPKQDAWIVDEDSRHILEGNGGNYPIQELRVQAIRAIGQDEE